MSKPVSRKCAQQLARALLMSISIAPAVSDVEARPFRGSVQWSILLCKTSDAGSPPHPASYYYNMAFAIGAGGHGDFWDDISYGSVNFAGSEVKGWYTMSVTTATSTSSTHDRPTRVNDCVNAASASSDHYTVPAGRPYMVVTYPGIDMFGWTGGAYLPHDINVGGMAHEAGHGLGLNHSFSDDPIYRNASWAQIGEYDEPWDVMSWANSFTVPTTYGDGPVGMNGYHLDRMGWLQRSRIVTFGSDGVGSRNVTLAALNHPEASGPMVVRVPFDPADLNHYYTVEFRKKDGWGAGLPDNVVLIHEIKKHDGDVYYSFLLRQRSDADPGRSPVQTLNANGVVISVVSTNPGANQATVSISSDIVNRCLQGYVWREARPSDHVCVPPSTRSETAVENAAAPSRRAGGGPYGPDTCVQGYVWREAYPGDHVCVTPVSRTRASQDDMTSASRINPARITYGPNTCKVGYVWREADDRDWVCVTAGIRTQARNDNAAAPSRRAGGGPYGPDTCVQGYVWREAYPGDHVCVTPTVRSQAGSDNADAPNRLTFQ